MRANALTMELAARTVTGPFVDGVAHTGTVVVVVLWTIVVVVLPFSVDAVAEVDGATLESTVDDDEVVETVAAPPPHDASRSIPISSDRADRDPIIGQPPR